MWVNPAADTLGAPWAPTYVTNGTAFPLTSTGGDAFTGTIRSFFIREGGNAQGTATMGVQRVVFDELRIGTSWADVTSNVPCTPPAIQAIATGGGSAGTQLLNVSVSGTNFVQGVTEVRLKMTGQPDIVAANVNVVDPENLVCDIAIPGNAAAGARDVVVTTCPDSPATLGGAFQVSCDTPTIAAVSPASGFAGATVTPLTVSGTNFAAGATGVRLTMPGQPDIVATGVAVSSPSSLTCTVALPSGAVAGLRTVQVATCAAATLADAFNLRRCNDPRYDGDGDGDVDMGDFAEFQRCLTTGSGGPADPICRCMNADGNTEINLPDLNGLLNCASGPGVAADTTCDDALSPL
jgi:hypothetical protein